MPQTMQQAENKTAKIVSVLVPLFIIIISVLLWFIADKVPSGHATSFLFHQMPALGFLFIAAPVWLVIVVIGVARQTELMTSNLWPHILLGVLAFACWFAIGVNRYNCQNDVNVSSRYNAYKVEKGWTE